MLECLVKLIHSREPIHAFSQHLGVLPSKRLFTLK
jgi:hypothetical protein